jgi:hypothetical protein
VNKTASQYQHAIEIFEKNEGRITNLYLFKDILYLARIGLGGKILREKVEACE